MEASAARSVFDFLGAFEDFFHVLKDALGFGERTAGWSVVIENEAAFIHCGEQVRFEEVIADSGEKNNDDGTGHE